jgi:hypothetical protein
VHVVHTCLADARTSEHEWGGHPQWDDGAVNVTPAHPRGGAFGVHVVGRKVYLALRAEGTLHDHPDLRRAEPSQYMDSADALYDFCQRFQQLLSLRFNLWDSGLREPIHKPRLS